MSYVVLCTAIRGHTWADAAELVSDDDLESWVAEEVARLDSEDQAR